MHRAGAFFSWSFRVEKFSLRTTVPQPGCGLQQTLTQHARTRCGIRVGARSSGAGRRRGPPSGRSRPPLPGAPPRTRTGEGCWRRPSAQTPQRSPRASAAASELSGRPCSAARNQRLWPGLFQRGSRMRSCASWVGSMTRSTFGRREEGAPCQHLQPLWPRHDPLLLCQCGHLAERHQPAVSLPLQMLRKFAFPSAFSQHPEARTSERGRKRSVRATRSRHIWVGRWGEGVGGFVEAMSVWEPGGQMSLSEERRSNLEGV